MKINEDKNQDQHWMTPRDNRDRYKYRRKPSEKELNRREALTDWFGELEAFEEVLYRQEGAQPAGKVLDGVISKLPSGNVIALLSMLKIRWSEIVGETAAKFSEPVYINRDKKELVVSVCLNALLSNLKKDSDKKFSPRLFDLSNGMIEHIHFQPGAPPEKTNRK